MFAGLDDGARREQPDRVEIMTRGVIGVELDDPLVAADHGLRVTEVEVRLPLVVVGEEHVGIDCEGLLVRLEGALEIPAQETRAAEIDPNSATDFGAGAPNRGGTVYLTAADASGMMVSFIQSNYMGFGSGVVVPGTGVSLQNRGAGFSLDPSNQNFVEGPAGLMDRPRGGRKGSNLPELTKRAILMLKEA